MDYPKETKKKGKSMTRKKNTKTKKIRRRYRAQANNLREVEISYKNRFTSQPPSRKLAGSSGGISLVYRALRHHITGAFLPL